MAHTSLDARQGVDHLYKAGLPRRMALIGHSPYTLMGCHCILRRYDGLHRSRGHSLRGWTFISLVSIATADTLRSSPAVQQMMRNLLANFVAVKRPLSLSRPAWPLAAKW